MIVTFELCYFLSMQVESLIYSSARQAQTVAHVAAAAVKVPVAAQVKVASVLQALKEAPEDERRWEKMREDERRLVDIIWFYVFNVAQRF